MRLTCPSLAVDGRAMMALPSRAREAPRTKSTCPPMPEKKRPRRVSDATWPVRSTASAELMETIRSLRAITVGSLVKSDARSSSAGWSSAQR
jgi:hypothetical protein